MWALDAGSFFDASFAGTTVPTLQEVLDTCRGRYQQILRVVAHQSDKSYKPKLADYLTVASAPFLGTANTSIAEYVWLPMRFEGEMPVIDWHDEWTVDELADNLREIRKTN